jgi:hypothetical protein
MRETGARKPDSFHDERLYHEKRAFTMFFRRATLLV